MTYGLRSEIADFGWPKRLALYAFLYVAYVSFTILVDPPIMRFIDTNYPGVFFYHLEADEASGPLGDLGVLLASIVMQYIIFTIAFIPIAIKTRIPVFLLLIIAILNEPIIFVCQLVWFILFSFG